MRAILLNPYQESLPKKFGHSTRFSIGGNSRPKITWRRVDLLGEAGWPVGLSAGEGERGGDVPHLPEQQAEVGDDEGDAERHQLDPRRVLDEQHGDEDEAEPDQEAEQGGAHQQAEEMRAAYDSIGGGQHEVHAHDGEA